MDLDEEPSSYLNYLNDGDTANNFLLGNNEVMMDPMFMDVADWPNESFSLLRSSPLLPGNTSALSSPKKKAPLILTEENCASITTTNPNTTPQNVETCTIIAENGTEQTIMVDKNFGVISSANHPPQNISSSLEFVTQSLEEGINNFVVSTSLDSNNTIAAPISPTEELNSLINNVSSDFKFIPSNNQKSILKKSLQNGAVNNFQDTATSNLNINNKSTQSNANLLKGSNNSVNIISDVRLPPSNQKSLLKSSQHNIAPPVNNFPDFDLNFEDFNIVPMSEDNFCNKDTNQQEKPSQSEYQNAESQFENSDFNADKFHIPDSEFQNDNSHYQNTDFLQNPEQGNQLEFHIMNPVIQDSDMDYQNEDSSKCQNPDDLDEGFDTPEPEFQKEDQEDCEYQIQPDSTTYINYDPIVKEKENGIREIYLTEKDIFNDAKIIQLLNSDGTIITIDKALFSSIDMSRPRKSVLQSIDVVNIPEKPPDIADLYTSVTAQKCKICGVLQEKVDDIIAHIVENHGDTMAVNPFEEIEKNVQEKLLYDCQICKDISFSTKRLRDRHYNKVHSEVIVEEMKEKPKKDLQELLDSLVKQQQKALRKFKCTAGIRCNLTMPTEELLRIHEKMHISKNEFKCLECPGKFYGWRYARSHMFKRHEVDFGTLICPLCSRFYSFSSAALKAHMNRHKEDDKTFRCPLCNKGFPSYNKMKTHRASHKPGDPTDVTGWPILENCKVCGMSFSTPRNLKTHVKEVHENIRPYVCKICGHKTSRKSTLELHLRQHTGAKPYKCLYCDYRSADHNCLRRHMTTHVKAARKYTCPDCAFTCVQSIQLKNHLSAKHPNRPGVYRCEHCSYTSINEKTFTLHQQKHNLGKNNRLVNQVHLVDVATSSVPDREIKTDTDDDTQNCFYKDPPEEAPIDTGGITIPAGFDLPNLDLYEDSATAIQ